MKTQYDLRSNRWIGFCLVSLAWLWLNSATNAQTTSSVPSVHIVTGANPSALESFAAREMSAQLARLFGARVSIDKNSSNDSQPQIILAQQTRLNQIAGLKIDLPKLAEQDHALKTGKLYNQSVLVVSGGSAHATLWAAYELGWRYGVRYFLFGDLYPAQATAFTVEGHDIVLRPSVVRRTWYVFTKSPAGTVSWGLDEHKRTLTQLAKLKTTHVIARASDLREYESAESGIVVSGDTQGRTVFGGAKLFDNPELASVKESSQRTAALESLVSGILSEAERLGMSTDRSLRRVQEKSTSISGLTLPLGNLLPTTGIDAIAKRFADRDRGEIILTMTNPNDAAPETIFGARAAFATELTPAKHAAELLDPVCGEGVAERVSKALSLCAQATDLISTNDPQLGVQSRGKWNAIYASNDPVPDWWLAVRDSYLNAMNEMYRANTRAREGGRQYTLYFARRFEFGFEYMNAVEAVRKAGIAQRAQKSDEAITELEKALDSITGACNAMAAVARSNSDRGIIALMNQYAYRPVSKLLEETQSQ